MALFENLSIEARVEAQEILLRALFRYRGPIERLNVKTEIGLEATGLEVEAVRAQDPAAAARAAEVRVALERMTE